MDLVFLQISQILQHALSLKIKYQRYSEIGFFKIDALGISEKYIILQQEYSMDLTYMVS